MASIDPEILIIERQIVPLGNRSCHNWWFYPNIRKHFLWMMFCVSLFFVWISTSSTVIIRDVMLQNSYGMLVEANCTVTNIMTNVNSSDVYWLVTQYDRDSTTINITYSNSDYTQNDTYNCWVTDCLWNATLPLCTNTYSGFDAFSVYSGGYQVYTPFSIWTIIFNYLWVFSMGVASIYRIYLFRKVMKEYLRTHK